MCAMKSVKKCWMCDVRQRVPEYEEHDAMVRGYEKRDNEEDEC